MLGPLAVLAVALSAPRTEEQSQSLSPGDHQEWEDPRVIISQCIQFKEAGAFWDRADELEKNVFHALEGKKIVLVVPTNLYGSDPDDHAAARQYGRVLRAYKPLNQSLGLQVVGHFQYNNTVNGSAWSEIPEDTDDRLFVAFGMADGWGNMLPTMHDRGSKLLMVHDSLCYEQNSPYKHGFSVGCPLIASDFVGGGGVPPRMYFAPWGTESASVWPEKSDAPSLLVDATREWYGTIKSAQFVQAMRDTYPTMRIVVLGDGQGEIVNMTNIELYEQRLPLADFQQHVRETWFFATGIVSSYELSISDAAMAGAVLVDINRAAKKTVSPPATLHIDSHADMFSVMEDAIRRFKEESLAAKTRKWAEAFHGEKYVALNLACSLYANAKDFTPFEDVSWSSPSPPPPVPPPGQPEAQEAQEAPPEPQGRVITLDDDEEV